MADETSTQAGIYDDFPGYRLRREGRGIQDPRRDDSDPSGSPGIRSRRMMSADRDTSPPGDTSG
jgi:hypothetical protein